MSLTIAGATNWLYSNSAPITGYPLTLFCWINPNATSLTIGNMCFGIGDAGGGDEFAIYGDGVAGGDPVKAFSKSASPNASVGPSSAESMSSSAGWKPAMAVFTSTTSRTIYYGAGAAVTDTTSNSPNFAAFDRIAVGVRPSNSGTLQSNLDIAELAMWSSALDATDWAALAGGAAPETVQSGSLVEAWSLETYNASTQTGVNSTVLTVVGTSQGSTHPITRTSGDLSGEAVLSGITAEGGMATAGSSDLSGEAVLSGISADGGMGLAPGVITTPVLKNNAGTILASVSGIVANIYHPTTGALVVRKTGLTSDGSGIVTITDVLLSAGTTYAYELDLSASSQGRRLPTGVAA